VSDWYKLEPVEALHKLGSNQEQGLSEAEVNKRLAEGGNNELVEKQKNRWRMIWEQLTASMVLILIAAAVASAIVGDYKDSVAIMAIVVFIATLGFYQEYKAEKAISALKKMSVPTVKLRRDGRMSEVLANDIVPGDILLLEAGNVLPADGRIIESANLRVQEAALTGESLPVEKTVAKFDKDMPLADRRNMVYMGTMVTYGRGVAVLTETGMRTELGKIAHMIQNVEERQTPLQQKLDHVGKVVTLAALAIIAVVVTIGLIRGGLTEKNIELMLLTGISLVVAAVPEGLAAVVTITLALGAQRMLKRNALIRRLPAVETLGSVTVICSDKTGTLTENRMTVTALSLPGEKTVDLTQHVRHSGRLCRFDKMTSKLFDKSDATAILLAGGTLCNDAVLSLKEGKENDYRPVGDPTETAIVVAAAKTGLWKFDLEAVMPRVAEIPFDSARKRMTTFHKLPDSGKTVPEPLQSLVAWAEKNNATHIAFTKGAIDGLLQITHEVWVDGKIESIKKKWDKRLAKSNDEMAQNGMRVIGVAFRLFQKLPKPEEISHTEQKMTFVGMVGMIDPARYEVKDAVRICKTAGIRPVMITGDHPLTALSIAKNLGITDNDRVITGQELESMNVDDLQQHVDEVAVYARVSPEHKLKIVEALQKKGHIVAMTGDGVNDAPALKKADIGVAMGITGTEVAKEAAAMVLEDDNFATIVAAVEEGRVIYDSARRFIKYLMTCNSGALWMMLFGSIFVVSSNPGEQLLFLLPLQILWINLMGDGLAALALGIEKPEREVMKYPPYRPGESVFSRGIGRHAIWGGVVIGMVPFVLGTYLHLQSYAYATWQTMVFTTFIISRMCHAMAIRSGTQSVFSLGFFTNRAFIAVFLLTLACQLAFIYVGPLQKVFLTTALSLKELGVCLLLSTVIFWAVEIEKWLLRRKLL
jgi:Ca2+-transporting ATPase